MKFSLLFSCLCVQLSTSVFEISVTISDSVRLDCSLLATKDGSSMSQRTQKATIARSVNREKKKIAILNRSRGRLLQKAASAQASPKLTPFFEEVNALHKDRLEQQGVRGEILSNIMSNLCVSPSRRRYTLSVLFFSLALATASYTAYTLAREYLVLPSYSWLMRFFKREFNEARDLITNIDKMPLAIMSFLNAFGEEKQEIQKYGGFLAVDAISMRPHVFVRKDGIVEGLIEDQKLNDTELGQLTRSFSEYEKFVKSLRNKTITDSFVYQYQPLLSYARCLPVFIEPSTQGKATGHEIDRLDEIAQRLEQNGLPVEGLAFDGDSTYAQLHRNYFDSYANQVAMNTEFKNFSTIEGLSIVSDPLHLLKRGRYRLLSSIVHSNFENTTESQIEIDRLERQLDLPSVVFSCEKYTKMHDNVAVQLFSMDTLVRLFEARNYTSLSYFLPLCLLCASLHEPDLTLNERYSFLELAFFYMLTYYRISSTSHSKLRQHKLKAERHVVAFDAVFAREFCNTVCSILKVMSKVNGTVSLNRIGSNPVEHLFGMIRMKSRHIHTYDKMLRVMSKTVLQKKFLLDFGEQKIDSRLSYFAQDVLVNSNAIQNVLGAEPRDLAFVLHCIFGLPVTSNDLMVWDAFTIHGLRTDLFENLRSVILAVGKRHDRHAKVRLTSADVAVTTGAQIKGRLAARKILS